MIVKQESDLQKAEKQLAEAISQYLATLPESQRLEAEKLPFAFTAAKAEPLIKTFNSAWYRQFLSYDTKAILKHIKVPVLIINGDRDWIAPADKVLSFAQQALKDAGDANSTLIKFPNLNHMFQTCTTGALSEYATTEETMAPVVLKTITDWILERMK